MRRTLQGGILASGYKLIRKDWPAGTDPLRVMWAQTLHPDESKIRMTFRNDTQFPEEGIQSFSVDFINGKAVSINKAQSSPVNKMQFGVL